MRRPKWEHWPQVHDASRGRVHGLVRVETRGERARAWAARGRTEVRAIGLLAVRVGVLLPGVVDVVLAIVHLGLGVWALNVRHVSLGELVRRITVAEMLMLRVGKLVPAALALAVQRCAMPRVRCAVLVVDGLCRRARRPMH